MSSKDDGLLVSKSEMPSDLATASTPLNPSSSSDPGTPKRKKKKKDLSAQAATDGPSLLAILFTEFLGAMLFTYVGGGSVAVTGVVENEAINCMRTVTIAVIDGFAFYALIFLTMKLSHGQGGYYNPAVTISLVLVDLYLDTSSWRRHLTRWALYLVAQILGGITGALLIMGSVPGVLNGVERTGISFPNLGESLGRAFVLESLLSFFLILVVLSVRSNEKRHSSLLLGFAFMAVRLVCFPLTGGSLNFARSFGHAVAAGGIESWKYIWVSFLGPMLGAGLATSTFLFLHHRELRLERSD